MKGTERNKPCPCGSGKKAKRCDHPVRSPYEGVRVVRVDQPKREGRYELATSNKILTAAALSMMVNG